MRPTKTLHRTSLVLTGAQTPGTRILRRLDGLQIALKKEDVWSEPDSLTHIWAGEVRIFFLSDDLPSQSLESLENWKMLPEELGISPI